MTRPKAAGMTTPRPDPAGGTLSNSTFTAADLPSQREPPPPRQIARLGAWGGLALHVVLSIILTWPLVLDLGGNGLTPGTMVEDRDQNLWNLWWVKTALIDLHTDPFHTNWMYWPQGVSLQFHTLNIFNGLISIPFQPFLPLPVIYDGIVLLSFILTGWGSYLLIRYLLLRGAPVSPSLIPAASAVGSAIFTYSAYHLATQRGLLQLISLEWVPFYVLALVRAVHEPVPWTASRFIPGWWVRRALPAAGFLLLVALVDWYYVMYTLVLTGVYGLYLLFQWLFPRTGGGRMAVGNQKGSVLRVTGVVALFFVLVAPLLVPMFNELRQTSYMRPAPGVAVENSADLLAFFLPPRFQHLWGSLSEVRATWPFANNTYEVYLGYLALALALVGLFWRQTRATVDGRRLNLPGPVFWALSALLFWSLTLGPVLQVNGVQHPEVGPMPYALVERIPGFNISRSPDRFAMPLMLCLGVLAAYGAARVGEVLTTRSRRPVITAGVLALGLLTILVVELSPIPYPQLPAPVPGFLQTLAADPSDYAILELPRENSYWHGAFRMYFQTAHHKRIFYGYISREYYHPFLSSTPGFQELQNPDGLGDIFADGPGEWLTALASFHTRYVVLYKAGWRSRPPADETALYRQALTQVLGSAAVANPVHSDADLDLYAVPPPPAQVPYLTLGQGWGTREASPEETHRWIRNNGTLGIETGSALHATLVFTATALGPVRPLEVRRDTGAPTTVMVGPPQQFQVDLGVIPAGSSTITLDTPGPVHSPKELGMNEDTRLLGIAFSKVRLEVIP